MAVVIIDTSTIIDAMRGDVSASAVLSSLRQKHIFGHVSAITIFELFTGITHGSLPHKEKQRVLSVLENLPVIPLDDACAKQAGFLQGSLLSKGSVLQIPDVLIAGTALHHNFSVLTKNEKDFSRIPSLSVVTY